MTRSLALAATVLVPVALSVLACQRRTEHPPAPDPYVVTTFYPTTYFAQRIAGDRVEVVCPLPDGADPIFWHPSRDVLAQYQGARLVIVNGADFERWLPTVSLPQSRVVDTAAGFKERFLKFQTATHSHGAGGTHTHEGIDGHTWVDPQNAKMQAKALADALARAFPAHASAFATGLAALQADLDALAARAAEVTPLLAGVKLLASHPAYDYLAARHGWTLHNLDLDPDAALSADDLAAIEKAKGDASRCVLLWEGSPGPATTQQLDSLGVASVLFSPAENVSPADLAAGQDYLAIMRGNFDRLVAALQR